METVDLQATKVKITTIISNAVHCESYHKDITVVLIQYVQSKVLFIHKVLMSTINSFTTRLET